MAKRYDNTTDSMKQINLQATGVLDDLTHFRYATMLGIFFIKFAILCGSQIYY